MCMQRIERFIYALSKLVVSEARELGPWSGIIAIYDKPVSYERKKEGITVNKGDRLIRSGETIFLEQKIDVPPGWGYKEYGLNLVFGAEGRRTLHEALVYVDGSPYHGIDRNRSYVPLPSTEKSEWHIQVELYNPIPQTIDALNEQNEPAEYDPPPLYLLENQLVLRNKELEDFLYFLKVNWEAVQCLSEESMERIDVHKVLTDFVHQVEHLPKENWLDPKWVQEQKMKLKQQLQGIVHPSNGMIHLVGQSHIDLAWLWPAKEAVRKCSRTFSTMSTLIERHPSFTYAQSQPQAFSFMKHHYPEVFKRVKKLIKEGRFELVGGMWVEPDLNMPSGESLVRQLLYGLTFYQEEFGKRPRIEWLPDTFGYCASLPQILRLAGMEYFMTTKMNWNDTNPFPYDLFHWVGIDGTSILSYLNHGVNEYTHPKEINEHWRSFKQKNVHPEQMLLYGHGDGGGGVTREMIAYADQYENVPGFPKVRYSTAHDFFDSIANANPELPTWHGDLYLELHRGTYTTHAFNKKANRFAEGLYREAELWNTFASLHGGKPFSDELKEGWKSLLFNQFHDIIPGTSIPEVYAQSKSDYEQIFATGERVRKNAIQFITERIDTNGEGKPYVIFNSLSWDRGETVRLTGGEELRHITVRDADGQVLPVTSRKIGDSHYETIIYVPSIPAMGYTTIWISEQADEKEIENKCVYDGMWETEYYVVKWNERGEITSLFDKEAAREIVLNGQAANQFQLFHDRPLHWDAWDIDPEFERHPAGEPKLINAEVLQKGCVQDILRFTWHLSHSEITQEVIFSHHHKRIDFKTRVKWNEEHKLLKVAFPVDIQSAKATYEIPFGVVERPTHQNTSWERAQFEVCGQRFADLSENNYGVSLLNDCKYGYDIKGQTMRLSLLRASKWPDRMADIGEHTFVYSLYPHIGGWQEAQIVRRGYELNQPVVVQRAQIKKGVLPQRYSFLKPKSEHVIVDTVKPAEDKDGLVIRLYESSGGRDSIEIETPFKLSCVEETNLLEETIKPCNSQQNQFSAIMRPFEIKTFRLHYVEEEG